MDALFRELRFAFRMLLKNPGSSFVAALAMALGIALTTTMFAVLNGVFLDGLPFEESDRLMHLERNNLSRDINSMEVTPHDLEDWQKQQKSFESLGGFTGGTFNLSDEGLPERYNGSWISVDFLDTLRLQPALGRGFEPADAAPDAEQVLILSHQVWMKRYGGSRDVIGQLVRVNSEPATIVGVMPEGINFPINEELWMPLKSETGNVQRGEGTTLEVFGRLLDGVSIDRAAADMATIARRLEQEYPETNEGVGAVVQPYMNEFIGEDERQLLTVMFVAVLLVLLIACFNVANLLIGRASVRSRELAVRSALGSGRWRAVLQVLSEAGLLSIGGAILGVGMAHFAVRAFGNALATTDPPFWMQFSISPKVLAFAITAATVAAIIAGLVPALQASRADVSQVLSDSSRGSTSFRLGRLSRALVIAEVAISFALLIGATLTVRSVLAANNYELGFETDRLLSARMGLFEGDYPEEENWITFFDELRERVGGKAEVAHAAIGTVLPTDTEIGGGGTFFERAGETYEREWDMPWARYSTISPGYWDTIGVELLAGRDFSDADRDGAPAVAIVNQDFVRREWPEENPIGQRINLYRGADEEANAETEPGWVEVIGVAPNLRFAEFDDADDQHGIYVPLAQNPVRFAWIIARTKADPLTFAEPLRRTVLELDPNLPLYYLRSMDQVLERTMFFQNLIFVLFGTFGVAALLLTSVGLYGVVAFGVSQRIPEIGVRMAFGARARDILGMILRQGLSKVAIGLVLGLLLAAPLAWLLGSMLFQVEPADPVTFLLTPLFLTAVTILACMVPARRASGVDPIHALHYE